MKDSIPVIADEVRLIKDHIKLTGVLNSLRPTSARLLLHFLLTKEFGVRFPCTLYNMALEGKVKNPSRAIKEILGKGYMSRIKVTGGSYRYSIHVDLIE